MVCAVLRNSAIYLFDLFSFTCLAACAQAEQEYMKGVAKEKTKLFPKLYKPKKKKRKATDGVEGETESVVDDNDEDDDEFEDPDGSLISE